MVLLWKIPIDNMQLLYYYKGSAAVGTRRQYNKRKRFGKEQDMTYK